MTPTPARNFKARVLEARDLTPETRHFKLDVPELERFDFLPGQGIKVTLAQGGQFEERTFALASKPDGNRIELVMAATDDKIGKFLRTIGKGHRFLCFGPTGKFTLEDHDRDLLFIATASGVSPLRAMIEKALEPKPDEEGQPLPNADREIALILGARSPDRLPFLDEFVQLAVAHPNFRFTPTISRANREWRGELGRVQRRLGEALGQEPGRWDVWIAGRPQAVRDVTESLLEAGVSAEAIHSEA